MIGDLKLEDSIPRTCDGELPFKPKPREGYTDFLLSFMERVWDTVFCPSGANLLQVIKKFHKPHEGVHIAVGPTGIQLCSDSLYMYVISPTQKRSVSENHWRKRVTVPCI